MSYQLPDLRVLPRLRYWPLPSVTVICDLCEASRSIPVEQLANMPAGPEMPMQDAFWVLASGLCRKMGGAPDGGRCVAYGLDHDLGVALDG